MAQPSSFQERLQQMEETKNERVSLLEAEKELQSKRLLQLATKISNLRRLEQQCLIWEGKNATVDFQILAKKSELETCQADYQSTVLQYRALKIEIDELEKKEKQRKRFYEEKSLVMEEFKEEVQRGLIMSQDEITKMSSTVSELQSSLKELQARDECINDPDVVAAEERKSELLALKENMDKTFSGNQQLMFILKKQLESFLRQNLKSITEEQRKEAG